MDKLKRPINLARFGKTATNKPSGTPVNQPPHPQSAQAQETLSTCCRMGCHTWRVMSPNARRAVQLHRPDGIVNHTSVKAIFHLKTRRSLHVEGQHAVIRMAAQAGHDRHSLTLAKVVGAADIVHVLKLQHEVAQALGRAKLSHGDRMVAPRHAGHRCGMSVMRRWARVSKSSQSGIWRRNRHPTLRSISASTGDSSNKRLRYAAG